MCLLWWDWIRIYNGALPVDAYQDFRTDNTELGVFDSPNLYQEKHGECAIGVRQNRLNQMMRDSLVRSNIETREG